jgi:hypothetical protein
MGLFDFLKSKPKEPDPDQKSNPASEAEQKNHKRKSGYYKFAFQFFPSGLFARTESTIMIFAKGRQEGLESLLSMFNEHGGKLDAEDIKGCKLSYYDGFKGNRCALLISFPGTDLPTGNLVPVPAPYYSAIIYHPGNLSQADYFVLSQSFEGKTSIRKINEGGMNLNCGQGPAGSAGEMAFLEALQNLK